MSSDVTVATTCMRVVHDKKANLETYHRYIEQASEKDARLLAFPECSLQGYNWAFDLIRRRFVQDDEQQMYFQEVSETVPGPSTELLCHDAKKHNMYIQFGMAERVNTSVGIKLFNSAVLVGPNGLVGVHRKVHMGPNPVFAEGDRFTVFQTSLGRVGPVICADLQFPESVRCLAIDGAEVIVNSTAWGMKTADPVNDYNGYMYELLTKTQALMNQVWIIHADQIGQAARSKLSCYGHSRIVDPMGRILADTGYNEGLALATVDLKGELARSRSPEFVGRDLLEGRRPKTYRALYEAGKR